MELLDIVYQVPLPVMAAVLILMVLFTVYLAVKLIQYKKFEGIRKDVYVLFKKAEKKYGSGEGLQKMKWVISQARMLLPAWLQIFMSEDDLFDIFDTWFHMVEDFLDDGEVNGSPKEL